jgi:uncharacterized protein YaeQ
MKIRCDLHVNGGHKRLVIAPQETETDIHLALKLGAFLLFWDMDPKVEMSLKHPALVGQVFKPDLMALDETGGIKLWAECGKVAMHKLDKLTRRYAAAKVVVFKPTEEEGRRLRKDVSEQLDRSDVLDIWAWPSGEFDRFRDALQENTHVVGETEGRSLNLVINETPLAVELARF